MRKVLWLTTALLACSGPAKSPNKENPKPVKETATKPDVKQPDSASAPASAPKSAAAIPKADPNKDWKTADEKHLAEVRQLTDQGDNGEAYFSPDGQKLVFQSTRGEDKFDQIYTMNIDGSDQKRVSNGIGRTTCSYFTPDGKSIIYASTHLRPETPPKPAGHSAASYEWAFDPAFEIFKLDLATSQLTQLTDAPGYDAEDVFTKQGDKIYFTSMRDGDAEIYVMDPDGKNPQRLTNAKGYDGGPWPSPDGKMLVWRASRTEDYRNLQVYVANEKGENPKQLTEKGTNFAPSWDPTGEWIIFSSDMDEKYNYELYRIHPDGTGLERITYQPGFDGFPVFSPDGQWLVFASNRADPNVADPRAEHDTQVFRAKWVP